MRNAVCSYYSLDTICVVEELQRTAAQQHQHQQQPMSIDQHIDQLSGLSDHKRKLLREYPVINTNPTIGAMFNRHYKAGLQSGLRDDSAELDEHVISNMVREIEHNAALTSASARPTPENRERHQAATEGAGELAREAEARLGRNAEGELVPLTAGSTEPAVVRHHAGIVTVEQFEAILPP
jgi:hypothetical protein